MTVQCNLCDRAPKPREVLTLAMGHPDPAQRIYQCQKHLYRAGCVVPLCRRTFKVDAHCEILCGKHWRGAPKRDRLLHQRIMRKINRIGLTPQLQRLENKVFARIKIAAIEAAFGIDG